MNGEIEEGADGRAAAGGIISSVAEMSNWLKLQLRGGIAEDGDTLLAPTPPRPSASA